MLKKSPYNQGFTLIEMVVVIIILAILALLGVPRYLKLVEKGRASEGTHTLSLIHQGQQSYATYNGIYVQETDGTKPTSATLIAELAKVGMTFPNMTYFVYDIGESWLDNARVTNGNPDPDYRIALKRNTKEAGNYEYYVAVNENGQIKCKSVATKNFPPDLDCTDTKWTQGATD